MADIVIGGRLHSAATGNTVAGANEIMDDAQGKKQSVVNQDLANRISEAGQQQQAAIEAEAEARAAKDRELKALIDQGIIEGGGIVFDTEPTPESVNPVTSNGIAGTLGYNTENVEFVRVLVDSQNRVVFGIQRDGNVYFGAGVPKQIQTYVRDMMATIDLTDITTTLEQITDYLTGKLGTQLTLSDELDGKVDKVEGKSLIDAEYASSVSHVENPEFVEVHTDSEGRVLWGIRSNGDFYIGAGVPESVRQQIEAIDSTVNEKIAAIKAMYGDYEDNPEYVWVILDADDRVLFGIRTDGSLYLGNELPQEYKQAIQAAYDYVDEKFTEVADIVEALKHIITVWEDPEGRLQITVDAEGRMLSYRDKEGTQHETHLRVEKKLELSEEAMTDFQQALKDAGFQPGGGGDFSDREVIELPEPKGCALVNLIVDKLPLNDGEVSEGFVEYYDKSGNYFKIECSVEPQGQTSRVFAMTGGKGNYTLDVSNDVKFGSWVPQDSFHLKGAAKDVVRGTLPTSYKWAYMMQEFLNARPNRILVDESSITTTNGTGKRINDWPIDARCLPDGFPFELYINGEYYGIYAWQLKKHRKNYSMDKKDYTSLFIDADGIMSNDYQHGIWNEGPDAVDPDGVYAKWWNGFDIKGPKDLICMDGSDFDGDNPKELIDSTSSVYDSSNKKHKGSAQAKAIIRGFSTKYLEVKELVDNNDIVAAKAKFEENFDKAACILVYIFNCLTNNGDSIKKNTLWGTYANGKIFPMLWDLDNQYGVGWIGTHAGAPSAARWTGDYATATWPLALLWTLYSDEIKTAYANLRNSKIISIDTWKDIVFNQWVNRIGEEAYNRDIERWPETPSYREDYTDKENWVYYGYSYGIGSYNLWNENTAYAKDALVALSLHPLSNRYYIYKAVKANQGKCPVTQFYTEFPMLGGFYDSPKRWEKWMTAQIASCDVVMEYNQ